MILLKPKSDHEVPLLQILQWLPKSRSPYFGQKALLDLLSVHLSYSHLGSVAVLQLC